MLQGLDDIGLTLSYQSEGIGEALTSKIQETTSRCIAVQVELDAVKDISRLFSRYESELLPLLMDKDEYLKNHCTHQAVHEVGWFEKFEANRHIHLVFLNQKLLSNVMQSEDSLGNWQANLSGSYTKHHLVSVAHLQNIRTEQLKMASSMAANRPNVS
jgi:hypothetical protein